MAQGRERPRWRRMARAGLVGVALLVVASFAALELRLSGPFGISGYVAYRSLRSFARDALIPSPPSVADFPNPGPNAIVIVLDCFRRDYLDVAAPRLRSFAEDAWSYDRYYAAASWTKPSTVSLFTGLHVRRHYVTGGGGSQLPSEALTIAELLQEQGFATAGFVWNPHLTRRQAFDQGFDHYVDNARRGSKSLLHELFAWLDAERPQRFFAYVHFQGTHDPYYDDNDLVALLTAPAYPGDLDFSKIDYKLAVAEGLRLSQAEVAHLRHVALGKARRVDREAVAGFLERFFDSRLPENTLVMITSDHGDGFLEHEAVSHGRTVYEEEIHVPLLVHYPEAFARERGFANSGRDECLASTVDVLPTVADFLGVPRPDGIDGASLVPARGGRPSCGRAVVSERTLEDGAIAGAALLYDELKLIVDYSEQGRALRLYDLGSDPGEQREISDDRRARARQLDADLVRRLNGDGASLAPWEAVPGELSDEHREALRALGYVE